MRDWLLSLFTAPGRFIDTWNKLANDAARIEPGLNGRCKCGSVIDAPHISTVECWDCAHWRTP